MYSPIQTSLKKLETNVKVIRKEKRNLFFGDMVEITLWMNFNAGACIDQQIDCTTTAALSESTQSEYIVSQTPCRWWRDKCLSAGETERWNETTFLRVALIYFCNLKGIHWSICAIRAGSRLLKESFFFPRDPLKVAATLTHSALPPTQIESLSRPRQLINTLRATGLIDSLQQMIWRGVSPQILQD